MLKLKWYGYTSIADAPIPPLHCEGVYVIYNQATALPNTHIGDVVDVGQGDISKRRAKHENEYPNAYVTWTVEHNEHIRKRIEKYLQQHYELPPSPDLRNPDIAPLPVIPPIDSP